MDRQCGKLHPTKSNEEYFTDPVCKNGYFRGIETYNFVRDINSRYESYKKKIKS